MKIMLINPPGHYARAGSRWPHKVDGGFSYVPFPFWLAYAAAFLQKEGFNVDLKDCVALRWDSAKLKDYVGNFKPDIIVMETSAPSYKFDIETLKIITDNGLIPSAAVGYHATAIPGMHLQDGFEYAIIGEYELPLLDLARYIDGVEKSLPEAGIASKANPNALHGPFVEELDSIPLPARDLLPMDTYVDVFAFGRSIQVITSRGCPFKCSFCCETILPGKAGARFRSAENVCDEIEFLIKKHNPDEIYFDDSSFTINRNHVLAICDQMNKRGIKIKWSCMADAKVNEEELKKMAESGCRAIKFGVESADQDVLAAIPKHVDLDDVRQTVKNCKKYNIKTHATFVFGLPGETKEKASKTIDFVLSLGTDTAQFSVATPYPGTRFYKMAEENGWLISKDWEDYGCNVVIEYPGYTKSDIFKTHKVALARWQRHLAFGKPSTVWHYIRTAYRRGGVIAVVNLFREGINQLLKGLRWF